MRRFTSAPDWLNALAEQSLGNFEITEALDARLSALAVRAKTDDAARYELLTAFAYKIARFHHLQVRRAQAFASSGTFHDADDLAQDAWLAFAGVVESWRPRASTDGSPYGFAPYFFAVFPLRLSGFASNTRRADRVTAGAPSLELVEHAHADGSSSLDERVAALQALERIGAHIPPADLQLVLAHRARVFGGALAEGAQGMSRRTYYRRIARITSAARALA